MNHYETLPFNTDNITAITSHKPENGIGLDELMRTKGQAFFMQKNPIEPSTDFSERVISRVSAIERRRSFWFKTFITCIILTPWIWRGVWFVYFWGKDQFNVAKYPLGKYIASAYVASMTSPITISLLIITLIGIAGYLFGIRNYRRFFSIIAKPFEQLYNSVRSRA